MVTTGCSWPVLCFRNAVGLLARWLVRVASTSGQGNSLRFEMPTYGGNDEVVFIILIIGNVLKPLVQSCCIMAVYIMANQLGMALVSDEARSI